MISISKKDEINLINIQAYDAVYLLKILEISKSIEEVKEEELQKLSSLKIAFSTGHKYSSLDFELDNQSYLYILISTLIEKKSLLSRDCLFELYFQDCNKLLKKERQKLLSYNGFSSDLSTQKEIAELNYFINTIYYVSHIKKLFNHNAEEHLIGVGVTLKEMNFIANRSTE